MTDLEFFQDAGLYDPDAADAEQVRGVLHWLTELGFEPEAVIAAIGTGELSELAGTAAMRPMPDITMAEAADHLGISVDELDTLRRTTGLAPRPFDKPAFAKSELQAFLRIQHGKQMFTMDEANHFARVLGSSLARIADAAVSLFLIDIEGPARDAGRSEFGVARLNFQASAAVDGVASSLDPLMRMHLEDAIRRSREFREPGDDVNISRMAVGFVDLVGFTAFSEQHSNAEIGRLVREFEDTAYDLVADNGGRVVKLIGDEVMFVATDAQMACKTAMALIIEFRSGRVTPRGGLAYGELLSRSGDYYGSIVNPASRIGNLAVPCELLATPEIAERCPMYDFAPAGRRQLKGFQEPLALVSLNC